MPLAFSHEGTSGIVKQRMMGMKEMGDHAKSVGDMFKGKQPVDVSAIRIAANSFVAHGLEIPELLPDTQDSRHEKNRSLTRDLGRLDNIQFSNASLH